MSVNTKVNGELVKSAGLYTVTKPIGMADIYSTEEKEVGLWVDNKPLYQRTFIIVPSASSTTIDISSLNIDKLVSRKGTVRRESGSTIQQKDIEYRTEPSSYNAYGFACEVIGTDLIFNIEGYSYSEVKEVRITIQYTKTTDTPWSGKFVPQGYGYVSSGDIYSFEERQVGVYTDGKPLYQKTVDFGALPNNTTKQVAHNVANLDKIAYVNGIINYSGLIYGEDMPPVILNKSFRTAVRENVVEISTTDNLSSYGAIVTFQYTKTTDVAGSGEYVPSGDKAVHYSTDEEVIGTWIDGSTLYRKTIVYANSGMSGTSDIVIEALDSNIDVVSINCVIFNTGNKRKYILPYLGSNGKATNARIDDNNRLVVNTGGDSWANTYTPFIFTIEYTKSS